MGAMGADTDTTPITPEEFAAALLPLAPRPPFALAVSGGVDSMALAVLAAAWRANQGLASDAVTVLTVDHGLRPEAAAEAAQVGAWAAALGLRHVTLRPCEPAPARNVQAAARALRFALLAEWAARHSVADAMLAHHRDDQAETLLLRLARGSGVDGLGAMAGVAWWRGPDGAPLRVLRPLLGFAKARLAATLRAAGQPWIEDPSNADPRYARVRLRRLMPVLAGEGLTPARLAATAARMARARAALDAAAEALLGRAARFDPAGFATLDRDALAGAPAEIGLRALVAVLGAVGGGPYRPRMERTEALHRALTGGGAARDAVAAAGLGGGRTLAGCRIVPAPGAPNRVLVVREPARLAAPLPLAPGGRGLWDSRFAVALAAGLAPAGDLAGFRVGGLGAEGWRRVRALLDPPAAIPPAARAAMPGLWRGEALLAVPALGFTAAGFPADAFRARFPLRYANAAT